MVHRACSWPLILVFLASVLAAQVPTVQIPAEQTEPWRITSFLEDAGLEEQIILHCAFDAAEVLWIAASDGLFRFDGYGWTRFSTEHGLPSAYVRCVCSSRDGRLWVGTDRGAGVFDGRTFDPAGTETHLAGPSIRRIVEDPDGTLWFCCDQWPESGVSAGLTRLRQGQWKSYTTKDGLPSDYVSDYFRDSRGRQFVLTRNGLAMFDGERLRRPLEEAGLPGHDSYFWSMVESAKVGLVAATEYDCFLLEGSKWRQISMTPSVYPKPKLLATRDGEIFACSVSGFFRFQEDVFVQVTNLPSHDFRGVQWLLEAPDGSIWGAGYNSLLRWERTGGEWESCKGISTTCLCDGEGRLWFTGSGSVWSNFRGLWAQLEGATGGLRVDPAGPIWACSPDGFMRWIRGSRTEFTKEQTGIQDPVLEHIDGSGKVWVASRDLLPPEVACHDGHDWVRCPLPEDVGKECIRFTCPDLRSGMWCIFLDPKTSSNRLVFLDEGISRNVRLNAEARSAEFVRLAVGPGGEVWVFGFFGIFRLEDPDGGKWKRIEGLPGRHVFCVFPLEGDLWVITMGTTGGHSGITCLSGRKRISYPYVIRRYLGRNLDGTRFFATPERVCMISGASKGPPRLISLPGKQQVTSAVRGPDGTFWFGVEDQVLHYRPDGIPPETCILHATEKIHVGDDQILKIRGIEKFKPAHLSRRFFVAYKLDDKPWSEFAVLPEDVLTVSDLAVGPHEIRVRVRDEGLDVDPTPAVFRFQVFPAPIQERWWFWPTVIAVIIALSVLGLVNLGARRKVARHAHELGKTVQKRTAELRVSELKYRRLFEQSRDAIYIADIRGIITDCNQAMLDVLGYEHENMVGQRYQSLFVRDPRMRSILKKLFGSGSVQNESCQIRNAAGEILDVQVTANLRRDEEGNPIGYQALLRDVSRQKQLEERLRQSQKMEAIGRLAGGIAHDFNNILTAIFGYGELVARKIRGGQQPTEEVDMILKAADQARELTGQIQTFSRSRVVNPVVVDLNAVVTDLNKMLRRVIGEDIALESRLGGDACCIRIVPEQLRQIILNLCINARDAMPEGGRLTLGTSNRDLDAEAAQEASLAGPGRYVLLEVTDTGMGMDAETQQKIFDPFFTTKQEGHGTGLGLSTVYGIVTQNGGGIRVRSRLDHGTFFQIFFPCHEGVAAPKEVSRPSQVGGGQETILVVEDEGFIRKLLRETLQDLGYEVLIAADGEDALQVAGETSGSIDLLLTDVVMPGMNGRKLATSMRGLCPGIKVLFMSGYIDPDSDDQDSWEGEVGFIQKPFSPDTVKQKIREILDS